MLNSSQFSMFLQHSLVCQRSPLISFALYCQAANLGSSEGGIYLKRKEREKRGAMWFGQCQKTQLVYEGGMCCHSKITSPLLKTEKLHSCCGNELKGEGKGVCISFGLSFLPCFSKPVKNPPGARYRMTHKGHPLCSRTRFPSL